MSDYELAGRHLTDQERIVLLGRSRGMTYRKISIFVPRAREDAMFGVSVTYAISVFKIARKKIKQLGVKFQDDAVNRLVYG